MHHPCSRAVRGLRSQRGDTLIELLVWMLVTAVILGSLAVVLDSSGRLSAQNLNYDYAQGDARDALDQMVAQIRQAWNIVSAGPNSVDMDVNLGGQPYQVYYECDIPVSSTFNKCVRLQTAVGATLPSLSTAATVVPEITDGTVANPVFSWAPSQIAPYYMTATIDVPASDGAAPSLSLPRTIVFSDGALMRNENVEN